MPRSILRALFIVGALAVIGGCADNSGLDEKSASNGPNGADTLYPCTQDSDCPAGLTCTNEQCVANDGLPPEQTNSSVFVQPQTSAHYVFALSTDNNSVAVIDPTTLAIRSIALPEEPLDLAVIPGQDAAVIVEHAGESVSFLSCNATACQLQSQATARHYPAVSVSQDGLWAILWTPDPQVPDEGAEGIVAIVDVANLSAGTPQPIVERATGRRDTNAFFRVDAGAAVDAVVVGEDAVAVMDLSTLASQPLPQLVPLPTDFTDVDSRQTIASPDGAWVLMRSFASQNAGVFAVANRTVQTLAMPGTPSDIELSSDGSEAVVVLRDTGQIASFPLPAALTDPTQIQIVSTTLPAVDCDADAGATPCTASAGQAVLSNDGSLAVLFTNASPTMSFATLTLANGTVNVFSALEKLVDTLGIGPDGNSVIVLHQPDPNSTSSDPYQQMVDKSQGYSIVDLAAGVAELNLTNTVPPQEFVFSSDDLHAGVTLSDGTSTYEIAAIDLQTLVTTTLALASPPQFAGPFIGSTPLIWVSQDEPDGRISFLDTSSDSLRTVTGYTLNSGIAP